MSKYAPLEAYLENSTMREIPMKFAEIERIIDGRLPASSRKYPAWWSNESSTHVQAEAWKNAGYKTVNVNIENEKLMFIRDNSVGPAPATSNLQPRRHPAFGCMKGTVTFVEGVDLTDPADPEMEQLVEEMRLPE